MPVIEIFSMRSKAAKPPDNFVQIRCDRESVLGNPFYMKNDSMKERNRVCGEYDKWLIPNLNDARRAELVRILRIARKSNVALMCWCTPLPCHCRTIKRVLDKKLNRQTFHTL